MFMQDSDEITRPFANKYRIDRRSRSMLSVKNESFSHVAVEFKVIMKHPTFNGTYT